MNQGQVNPELKKKILFTIFVLLIYRFGTFVPIPGINIDVIKGFFESDGGKMFGMINLFSGGALERMSIFALNIMPYITASIIMQLLSSMHKGLEALKKEGEYGRAKINQYTRYLTIILAFFQSIGVYYALSAAGNSAFISDSRIFMWTTCVSLVGGTVMLMWFGERITTSGIGNGISLIIFVGIVSSLPASIIQMLEYSKQNNDFIVVILFFILFIAFLMFVCFAEKTYRKIKIQYPNAAMMKASGMSDSSFLPLKINISGVIPPIFASSILMFPAAMVQFSGSVDGDSIVSLLRRGSPLYLGLFAGLILFFSYFYSSIIFNTEEISSNLKKSNCFILGIRPGKATSEFLDKIIARLTLIGGLYLIFVCIIPEILVTKYSLPLYIGGTGILIMVNVVLDLINQVQSHLFSNKYGSNVKKRRVRVRGQGQMR
ncbi:MAG: preprotein translocase subunit SecY [Rickettsiales bacterium]|nr:preprotein translocase subunit SecY [Rickettsiales bacterium]